MSFTLFFTKNNSNIVMTQFSEYAPNNNLESTFNEKITIGDNDQITFTFSIVKYIDLNQINPYFKYVKLGQILTLLNDKRQYELVMTSIAPQITAKNLSYNVTCQDAFSYRMQRIRLGYSYSTIELGGIRTIYEIANDVINEQGYGRVWRVSTYNPTILTNSQLLTTKITLEVANSNPYNVLVEACNSLNASMYINYGDHTVHFYQKNATLFSGYRYHPEVNLKSINATYNFDEFATIMHVTGGTDAYGMQVMLVPPIPDAIKNFLAEYKEEEGQDYLSNHKYIDIVYTLLSNETVKIKYIHKDDSLELLQQEMEEVETFCLIADRVKTLGQFLYDFSFFRNNGLMTEQQHSELLDLFENRTPQPGTYTIASINEQLRPITEEYYNLRWQFLQSYTDGATILEAIMADLNQIQKYNVGATELDEEAVDRIDDDKEKLFAQLATTWNKQVHKTYGTLYGNSIFDIKNKIIPELNEIVSKIQYYREMRQEAGVNYLEAQQKYYNLTGHLYIIPGSGTVDPSSAIIDEENVDIIRAQEEINYYAERYTLANHMVGSSDSDDEYILTPFCRENNFDINNLQLKVTLNDEQQVVKDWGTVSLTNSCYYKLLYDYLLQYLFDPSDIKSLLPSEYKIANMIQTLDLTDGYINTSETNSQTQDFKYTFVIPNEQIKNWLRTFINNNDSTQYIIDIEEVNTVRISLMENTIIKIDKPNCDINNLSLNKGSSELNKYYILTGTLNRQDNNYSEYYYNAILSLSVNLYYRYYYFDRSSSSGRTYGLYGKMLQLQDRLDLIWKNIYYYYGDFIYETTYENSEEVDSLSLYNQAITYFENYRYPKSTYSISIVHPNELELMSTPNLLVNSHIRVYEDELNLAEGETYIETQENIDNGDIKLNTISYRPNELIVTGISYDLRKPEEASISVEQTIQYQSILQKLIKSIK